MKEQEQNLHPTVIAFKNFINEHPALLKEIRITGRPWQEYYEKWVLLGEDDPYWDAYKTSSEKRNDDPKDEKTNKKESKNSEWMQQLLKYAENLDMNKVQENVHQLSNAISSIQELLEQFQHTNQQRDPRSPFTHKD